MIVFGRVGDVGDVAGVIDIDSAKEPEPAETK
jgi:hypothetical protein